MTKKILPLLVLVVAACGEDPAPRVPQEDRAAEAPAGVSVSPVPNRAEAVLVLGTSLTAGLGVDPRDAYPAVLARRIDSLGLPFRVVNRGVSGQTSAGGLTNLDWLLRERVGVLVLELGANDGLRGLDPTAMRDNLDRIIERTRAAYPDADVVIAGMEAPPNMGDQYTEAFRAAFPEVARGHAGYLVPFLLDGVGGVPEYNQADGIHPNAAGHRLVADNVWAVLEGILRERTARRDSA